MRLRVHESLIALLQFVHPKASLAVKSQVLDCLSPALTTIRVKHIPLVWMKPECRSQHISEQEFHALGERIDWRVLYEEIVNHFKRSYRAETSSSQRLDFFS
jgi:hypothetical protein